MRTSQHYPATSYSAHARTHARVRAKMRQDLCTHMLRQSTHSRMHPLSRWHQRPAIGKRSLRCSTAWSVSGDLWPLGPRAFNIWLRCGAGCRPGQEASGRTDGGPQKECAMLHPRRPLRRCHPPPCALWLTPCTRVRPCACVRVGVGAWRVVEGRDTEREGEAATARSRVPTVGIHRRERCASHYCHCRRCSRAEQRPH
jgi:hypothetical protein